MQNIYAESCVLSTSDRLQRTDSELSGCPELYWCLGWKIGKLLVLVVLGFSFSLGEGGQYWWSQLRSDPLIFVVSQPDRKNTYERIQSFFFPLLYVTSTKVQLTTCKREEDVWIEKKCSCFLSKQPTINVLNFFQVTDIII